MTISGIKRYWISPQGEFCCSSETEQKIKPIRTECGRSRRRLQGNVSTRVRGHARTWRLCFPLFRRVVQNGSMLCLPVIAEMGTKDGSGKYNFPPSYTTTVFVPGAYTPQVFNIACILQREWRYLKETCSILAALKRLHTFLQVYLIPQPHALVNSFQ
jgi:hypothetical protein